MKAQRSRRLARQLISAAILFPVVAALVVVARTPDAFAAPKELRYKEMPLELREGDRLVISGIKAKIRLKAAADGVAGTLRASKHLADKAAGEAVERFESLTFGIRREGQTVIVEEKGPDSKQAWEAWLKPSVHPELILEIAAAPVAVEVNVREGLIEVQNWSQSILASLVSGQIKTKATEGLLRLQTQAGSVDITDHKGSAEIDSFNAKLSVKNFEGSLDLTNFAGESFLSEIDGRVEMLAHAGPTNIAKSSGSFEFSNGRGAVNLSSFDGQVRGKTDQGAVVLGLEGEAEVDVDSEQGNVAVRLPANSGAALQLRSEGGGIVAPEDIRTTLTSTHQAASGRLGGDGPKGVVAVRSKSGAIRVR